MGRTEILIVEDDPGDVAIAMRAFRRHGLAERVKTLRDAEEALRWVSRLRERHEEPPKVVFLDLKMPKLDGTEVLREMRAHDDTRDVPVVVVSSSPRDEDVRESYRLGANSFVRKRYEPAHPGEYLVRAALYWLELNQSPR